MGPRFPAEAVAGLRGAVALPAIHAGEVLAVLELCCEPVSVDVTAPLLRSLTGIGNELGEFLAHRRGELKPLALTPRELEVLQLASQGCAGRQRAAGTPPVGGIGTAAGPISGGGRGPLVRISRIPGARRATCARRL